MAIHSLARIPGTEVPGRARAVPVLLVHRDPMVVRGLQLALRCEWQLSIVGGASDLPEANSLARRLKPAVVVLDARIERQHPAWSVAAIRAAAPGARFVVISDHDLGTPPGGPRIPEGVVATLNPDSTVTELTRLVRTLAQAPKPVFARAA